MSKQKKRRTGRRCDICGNRIHTGKTHVCPPKNERGKNGQKCKKQEQSQ